ncbi:MAG: hypothetical protein MPJ79_06830 [Alphaproteobacteria bacterium]|nr:hypothetical protein [Alphaproteobacteria bacterium]
MASEETAAPESGRVRVSEAGPEEPGASGGYGTGIVPYTHLRAHETSKNNGLLLLC